MHMFKSKIVLRDLLRKTGLPAPHVAISSPAKEATFNLLASSLHTHTLKNELAVLPAGFSVWGTAAPPAPGPTCTHDSYLPDGDAVILAV